MNRSRSKQSLEGESTADDNESYITANSQIIDDYNNSMQSFNPNKQPLSPETPKVKQNRQFDSLPDLTYLEKNKSNKKDNSEPKTPERNYSKAEVFQHQINGIYDQKSIDGSQTLQNTQVTSIKTFQSNQANISNEHQPHVGYPESQPKFEVKYEEPKSSVQNRKPKKPRATSSYYEPLDTFDYHEQAKSNLIPDIDYRKSYALTNEYKSSKNHDKKPLPQASKSDYSNASFSEEPKSPQSQQMEVSSLIDMNTTITSANVDKPENSNDNESDNEQYDITNESILPDNINEAKEKLRKTMILSESLFENQNAILEKEGKKRTTIFNPNFTKSSILESNTSLSNLKDNKVAEVIVNDDEDDTPVYKNSEFDLKKEDFNHLFIISTRNFDKESLEEEEDKEVCLSFDIEELAFVHAVEESGWGEVTLIKSLKRGWVPLNYFTDCIKPLNVFLPKNEKKFDSIVELRAVILSRQYLAPLFQACGRFLVNPVKVFPGKEQPELDITSINHIQKSIKKVLISTGCISRDNEIVAKKILVKKTRKRLLADWYSVSLKADKYKQTSRPEKIIILKKMIFQLLRRAYLFYNIWSIEVQTFENEKRLLHLKNQNLKVASKKGQPSETAKIPTNIVYLKSAPMAQSRLNEVNNYLFLYTGLILGRMDLIENNSAGFEVLEYIIRQIVLLLKDLLYISKACSVLINEKYNNQYQNTLNSSLDPLLKLVSQLVSAIKEFIDIMLEKINNEDSLLLQESQVYITSKDNYKPSPAASKIIYTVSKMTNYITTSIVGCNNYLRMLGDFKLGDDREYSDFTANAISSNDFIKICSKSLLEEIKQMEWKIVQDKLTINKSLARYSVIQNGVLNNKSMMLNNSGMDFISEMLENDEDEENSLLKDKLLQQFTIQDSDEAKVNEASIKKENDKINDRNAMFTELEFDKETYQLQTGTLRGILCYLTDEITYQNHHVEQQDLHSEEGDQILLKTFFMSYKMFTDSKTLISLLISRFDDADISRKYENRDFQPNYFNNWPTQLRYRKRLVLKFIRTWLESYWDYKNDYSCLPILMNFFNETCNQVLPLETKNLMTILSNIMLVCNTTNTSNKVTQLVPNTLRNTKLKKMILRFSRDLSLLENEDITDSQMIEMYDLLNEKSKDSLPVSTERVGLNNLLTPREYVDVKDNVEKYMINLGFSDIRTDMNTSEIIDMWNNLDKQKNLQVKTNNTVMICDLNSMEVAKQLTLIESYIFATIDIDEFAMYLTASKTDKDSSKIETLVNFNNSLSNYIIESLVSGKTTSSVIHRFTLWLKIALSCYYFKNFNTVACIMTSLQNHDISRMKFIWNNLKGKDLELYGKLIKIMDPSGNYRNYRQKLKYFTKQLKKTYESEITDLKENNCVVIPFVYLFLQDLTMIGELNSATSSTNPNKKKIYINKFYKMTNILDSIEELQFFIVNNLQPALNLNQNDSFDNNFIANLPELQEYIIFDLWKVNKEYQLDPYRAGKILDR
ncbi:Ras family guanine nucleotide exchange factor [Hanseniaspora uvarum]|nr:Ras family guanine nucleotide exchange factor [Hanseniaspora uvarum]